MARDLDDPPVYDALIRRDSTYMSSVFQDWFATNYQTMIGYLSQYGIFIPKVTTAQRDSIQSPVIGQMIYNTTIDAPQVWQAGAWKTFTTS